MPMYPCLCPKCGPVDVYARVKDVDSLQCPSCKAAVQQDYVRKLSSLSYQSDEFAHADDSNKHGMLPDYDMHPDEVAGARQALAEHGLSHVVKDDGTVECDNKSEIRRFGDARREKLKRQMDGKATELDAKW